MSEQNGNQQGLYDARIEDLGPGDFVQVECACGHTERLSAAMLLTVGVTPHSKVQDPGNRMRCRECDKAERWSRSAGPRNDKGDAPLRTYGPVMARLPEHFRPICRYKMLDGRPQEEERIDSELWNERGVVYARVFEDEPVYIGSTDRLLTRRIGAHLRGIATTTQPTPVKYRKWAEGKRITIVAYKPPPVELLGRIVPVHRALEAACVD